MTNTVTDRNSALVRAYRLLSKLYDSGGGITQSDAVGDAAMMNRLASMLSYPDKWHAKLGDAPWNTEGYYIVTKAGMS